MATNHEKISKDFKQIRSLIKISIKKWKHLLWLSNWEVVFNYNYEYPVNSNKEIVVATVQVSWEYEKIQVDFYLPALIDAGYTEEKQIDSVVIHELIHAVINEMREKDPDHKHEERVVTHLTNIVFGLYQLEKHVYETTNN
jgi:hypothetical protein